MIIIYTDRAVRVDVRTNRRVRWEYAEYLGRYTTKDEALVVAKERMGETPFEYRLWNMATDETETGFVNWPRKK